MTRRILVMSPEAPAKAGNQTAGVRTSQWMCRSAHAGRYASSQQPRASDQRIRSIASESAPALAIHPAAPDGSPSSADQSAMAL